MNSVPSKVDHGHHGHVEHETLSGIGHPSGDGLIHFIGGIDNPYPCPVEADEIADGGKRRNVHAKKQKQFTGRGNVGKAILAGVKDRETRKVSIAVVDKTDAETLQGFVPDRTESTATVYIRNMDTIDQMSFLARGIPGKRRSYRDLVG